MRRSEAEKENVIYIYVDINVLFDLALALMGFCLIRIFAGIILCCSLLYQLLDFVPPVDSDRSGYGYCWPNEGTEHCSHLHLFIRSLYEFIVNSR